jgi:nucleotide-binding universal stress UspA family protein
MKILVGIDGSAISFDTLKYAIDESKLKEAKLSAILSKTGNESDEEKINARDKIKTAEKMFQDEGLEPDVHFLVRGNSPTVDIVKFAEENSYDLIIVGSHGRSGITRVLLGSVAEGVIRKAHCPVTVFRK